MADENAVSLLRQGDPYPQFGPELRNLDQQPEHIKNIVSLLMSGGVSPEISPTEKGYIGKFKPIGEETPSDISPGVAQTYNPSIRSNPTRPNPSFGIGGMYQPYNSVNSADPQEIIDALHRTRAMKQAGHYAYLTPEEREQNAHRLAQSAGVGASFLNPWLGATILGGEALSRGQPTEAASQAALAAVPYGLGKAIAAAPRLTTAALGAYGSSYADALAGDTKANENPFKWDQPAYEKRQQAAQRQANRMPTRAGAKFMTDFEAREGAQRAETEKNSQNWINSQGVQKGQADALSNYKASVEPTLKLLPETVQNQIRTATSTEQATKLYNDAMNERTNLAKTTREKYPWAVEGTNIVSALLGGGIARKLALGRTNSLVEADKAAREAYKARYGVGAPTDKVGIAQRDAELLQAKNDLAGATALSQHPSGKVAAGLMSFPLIAGAAPSVFDAVVNPYAEVRKKAFNEVIPGVMPDPDQPLGRDWTTALSNLGRSLGEGWLAHRGGNALANTRDFEKARSGAGSILKSIEDQAQMAKALRGPRTASAAPTVPSPVAPPSAPSTKSLLAQPQTIAPEDWGNLGVTNYSGAVLRNMQKKYGVPESTKISGAKTKKP